MNDRELKRNNLPTVVLNNLPTEVLNNILIVILNNLYKHYLVLYFHVLVREPTTYKVQTEMSNH